jgi:hypothetical protein
MQATAVVTARQIGPFLDHMQHGAAFSAERLPQKH